MDDIWSDTEMSETSFTTTESSPPPSPILTDYQNNLIATYAFHSDSISDLINIAVDLEISVRRERDEPSLPYLTEDLEKTRGELVLHRDAKRRIERNLKKEKLKMVVGRGSIAAKQQLNEIGRYMEVDKTIECLR
ncbi:hypothetical protein J4E83_001516 [Alternaria metachromatica]|uniref:uncharacterized protein n=1 Tax=Alternaria metachromatica TaxID=283354 RepID=UPI0020C27C25|nr:uncharacterized protein J4E83_001516 [Alternaria metachromatica]KAI4636561.1 hypothetical protein J4E83_001516 [Alternaria metachromatica]